MGAVKGKLALHNALDRLPKKVATRHNPQKIIKDISKKDNHHLGERVAFSGLGERRSTREEDALLYF